MRLHGYSGFSLFKHLLDIPLDFLIPGLQLLLLAAEISLDPLNRAPLLLAELYTIRIRNITRVRLMVLGGGGGGGAGGLAPIFVDLLRYSVIIK